MDFNCCDTVKLIYDCVSKKMKLEGMDPIKTELSKDGKSIIVTFSIDADAKLFSLNDLTKLFQRSKNEK